jgi:hypothetical protein
MEDEERKFGLWRGLLLALVPALLFFPAAGFLTICPPAYGLPVMVTISLAFLWSATAAIRTLWTIRRRAFDWINLVAVVGILFGSVVVPLVVYGLVVPVLSN